MTLHRITGRATKCGPSALSAILGIPTHEAAACIREHTGRKHVNGAALQSLLYVCRKYGRRATDRFARPGAPRWAVPVAVQMAERRETLASFLDARPVGTWLIGAGTHWLAYADGHVADSGAWFGRKPTLWTAPQDADPERCQYVSPKRRARIRVAVRIEA